MTLKYRFNLKDIKLEDFKVYLLAMFKSILPKKRIKNLKDLEEFIQKKSAWVSQETLYGYLKTRMGAKYVLMFEDEVFLGSINKAKWNIYATSLQDLTFFTISYLKVNNNLHDTEKAKEIFNSILQEEKKNKIPDEVFIKASNEFEERYKNINWSNYYLDLPFNNSALSLYDWSPIAEELKTLDKKIVLNSMILKWDNIKEEFISLINF